MIKSPKISPIFMPLQPMKAFLWSHGWGFDHSFFEPLSRFFPGVHHQFIDWGYFDTPTSPLLDPKYAWIGIGHSLGFLKLLKLDFPIQKYISICGFPKFDAQSNALTLLDFLMDKSPKKALLTFYKWCGNAEPLIKNPNQEALKQGLYDLRHLDGRQLLVKPLLVISVKDDVIAPPSISYDAFPSTNIIKKVAISGQSHMFGNNGLQECSQIITRYVWDKTCDEPDKQGFQRSS